MIFRRYALCGAAVLALACAAPALAQTAPAASTKVAKDASGNTFNLAGQTDASGNFHYRDVFEGLTPAGAPTAAYVDASGLLHVSNDILAPNAATATNQTTANGYLQTLAGAVSGGAVQTAPSNAAQAHTDAAAIASALTPTGGLPTAPSNAAQAHTDAIAPQSAAGTSAATAVTVQGSASGVALKTSEANSAAIAANTSFPGLGVTQLVPTTGTNTAPVALGTMPAGARAVRLYPETATGASVTIAWTRAASAAAAASQFAAGAYNTVSLSSTGPNWDESLTGGLNIYLGAVSGAATFAYQ